MAAPALHSVAIAAAGGGTTAAEAETDFFQHLEQLIVDSSPSMSTSVSTSDNKPVTAASVLRAHGAPSVSIAILDKGSISSHVITVEPGTDTSTLFQACSASKAIFGTLIMTLVDRGLLMLTDKMVNVLPPSTVEILKSNNPATIPLLNQITVAQLMSHTAGTSVSPFPGYPVGHHGSQKGGCPDLESIIAGSSGVNTMPIRVITLPGVEWMYSGGGIELLQAIVEHTTGEPMEKTMKREIFDVLGMDRSCYYLKESGKGDDNNSKEGKDEYENENVARAWYNGFTPCHDRHHAQPELGAAGLWTTPADLLKVLDSVQKSLLFSDSSVVEDSSNNVKDDTRPAILQREVAQKMLTRVRNLNRGMCMGHSWFCDDVSFGHGGYNFPGFRSYLIGYADLPFNSSPSTTTTTNLGISKQKSPLNSGICVMSNGRDGYEILFKVIHAITYLKGWPEIGSHYGSLDPGVPFAIPHDSEHSFPSHSSMSSEWKDWIGEWTAKPDKKIHTGSKDDDDNDNDNDITMIWRIAQDSTGKPVAGIRVLSAAGETANQTEVQEKEEEDEEDKMVMIQLQKAALPSIHYENGEQSVQYVMHGLEVLLRFGWTQDGRRVVTVRNHPTQSVQTLYKI